MRRDDRITETGVRVFLVLILGVLLFFPFTSIFLIGFRGFDVGGGSVARVVFFTAIQAFFSAALALIVGFLGALGLLGKTRGTRRTLELLSLAPNAVPVLLSLLAAVKLFPFARGLGGIVLVHTFINAGALSVAIARLAERRLASYSELAWVEGVHPLIFLRRVALPLLRRDLVMLFIFVFSICFTSFAVPLAIGGSRATTMEVLIFQSLRIDADWSRAFSLALIQTLAIFEFIWILGWRANNGEISTSFYGRSVRLISWPLGLVFALAPSLILFWGLLIAVPTGLREVIANQSLTDQLPELLAGSILIGFGAGFATVVLLVITALAEPEGLFRKILTGYVAPSVALTGFTILFFWRGLGVATFAKIAIGLSVLSLPSFYRFEWDSLLRRLITQTQVARTLGATRGLIFRRIVLPQLTRPMFFLGGLSALWAWGDFALSGIVAERTVTLAMASRGLMESYRLDSAILLGWMAVLGGFVTFAIFTGVGNVLGSKTQA